MNLQRAAAVAAALAVTIPAPTTGVPEQWKPVVGYEGRYRVSSRGRVRSLSRVIIDKHNRTRTVSGRILTQTMRGNARRQYLAVTLSRGGVSETRQVHHLVLEAFVGPRPPGTLACHFDDDHENNTLGNLRWDTPKSNVQDRIRNGTRQRALAVIETW